MADQNDRMNSSYSCALLTSIGLITISAGQSDFTYSMTGINGASWDSNWSGPSFPDEGLHSNGWGLKEPGATNDDYLGAYIGAQNATITGAKYYNATNYNATGSSLTYTMAWNPNGQKGFVDNGPAPAGPKGGGPLGNQIFQMGVFSSTPTNSWFGNSLTGSGHDAVFLAGSELTASSTTQMGSLNLSFYNEAGTVLADFGTLNYTAVDAAGTHHFNFRKDYVDLGGGSFSVSLVMDEYVVNPSAGTTTFLGQTDFGNQTFSHGLNSLATLTPGLGISVVDISAVSITAANYDGGIPVSVPEPSGILLLLSGLAPILLRRRR